VAQSVAPAVDAAVTAFAREQSRSNASVGRLLLVPSERAEHFGGDAPFHGDPTLWWQWRAGFGRRPRRKPMI
jgi:hypothetical protein